MPIKLPKLSSSGEPAIDDVIRWMKEITSTLNDMESHQFTAEAYELEPNEFTWMDRRDFTDDQYAEAILLAQAQAKMIEHQFEKQYGLTHAAIATPSPIHLLQGAMKIIGGREGIRPRSLDEMVDG